MFSFFQPAKERGFQNSQRAHSPLVRAGVESELKMNKSSLNLGESLSCCSTGTGRFFKCSMVTPKTLLLQTDGERGFVFCAQGNLNF